MPQVGYLNLPPGPIQAAGAPRGVSGIAPFKTDPDLINTTPEGGSSTYKLTQAAPPILASRYPKGIEWKSPERAYHGQKLLHLLARYTQPNGDLMNDPQVQAKRAAVINMINELNVIPASNPSAGFDPRKDFQPLMQRHLSRLGFIDEKAFNQACGLDFNNPKKDQRDNFMREVLELRYKQHPGFQDKVKRCCEQGKLLVEVSQHDKNWASGLDGQGDNRLGVLMMQVGNKHCSPPKVTNPRAAYDDLKKAQPIETKFIYNPDPKVQKKESIQCGTYLYHEGLVQQLNKLIPLPTSNAAPAQPSSPVNQANKLATTNAATLISSSGSKSCLSGIAEYSITDAKEPKAVSQRHNMDKNLKEIAAYTRADQKTVTVSYDKKVFSSEAALNLTLQTDATAAKRYQNGGSWCDNTKHRDVTSNVTCFANGRGEKLSSPIPITVTTGCAPNFMSSERELKKFTDPADNNKLKSKDYFDCMKLLFKRWFEAQDKQGVNVIICPLVGGGVYLNELAKLNPANKAEALKQISLTLEAALNESNFKSVKEVVFALPDDVRGTRSEALQIATNNLQGYKNKNPALTIANVDVLEAATLVAKQNMKVGIINPGSDRTIGGNYLKTADPTHAHKGGVTLEELLANYTNLAEVQAINKNTHKFKYVPYDAPALSLSQTPNSNTMHTMLQQTVNRTKTALKAVTHSSAAQEIASSINPNNPPSIAPGMQKGTLKALFSSEKEAQDFLNANQGKYKMSYHGAGEKYPVAGKFIVRFEREEKGDTKPYPESALNFVATQYKDKSKAEQQLSTVMKPWQSMKLGITGLNEQIGAKSMLSEEQKKLFKEAKKEILANRDHDTRANTLKCFTEFAKSLNSGNPKPPTMKDLEKCGLKGIEGERMFGAIAKISAAPEQSKRFTMH